MARPLRSPRQKRFCRLRQQRFKKRCSAPSVKRKELPHYLSPRSCLAPLRPQGGYMCECAKVGARVGTTLPPQAPPNPSRLIAVRESGCGYSRTLFVPSLVPRSPQPPRGLHVFMRFDAPRPSQAQESATGRRSLRKSR